MGVKEKLLLLGVLLAIAVAFLGHNYWPCVVAVLQRFVAFAFVGTRF